jgi:uncharacterized membrane protein YjgN (DUF898 family)
MMWFYSQNGSERLGPVAPVEFDQLVRSGVVTPDTLVWREGMPDWQPWRVVCGENPPASPPPMMMAPPPPPIDPARPQDYTQSPFGERPMELKFTGSAGEYFRIWIVNIVLTIVTFGIYAAWAKVRTKRYFYAHTSLAGHAFEYLAEPKRILIGNLIVAGIYILYNASAAISPLLLLAIMIPIMVAVPWLIVKSILFNARNSAWRGLRFGFGGRYKDALILYMLLPILVPLTLGLIWPYIAKIRREWVTTHHRFGTTPFQFSAQTGDFYQIYLKGVAFFIPLVAAYGIFIASVVKMTLATRGGEGGQPPEAMVAMMGTAGFLFLGGFVSAFIGAMYLRARLFTYCWHNTTLGPHSFIASMRARDLIGLQLVNMLVTGLTFGLAWPWAAVRAARFQLSCLHVVRGGDLDAFVGESQPAPGAIGEAAGDFLDFDIGFGV